MSDQQPVTVVKFGGSVLREGPGTFVLAAAEVERMRRAERGGLVVVVSAPAGVTDRLLTRVSAGTSDRYAIAAGVAVGELEATRELAEVLDRAGVPVRALVDPSFGLVAIGEDPLDSDPVALDPKAIEAGLAAGQVVLVPGYCAVDRASRPVLLGRGGSDLTAVCLAAWLGRGRRSRCLLLKDVGGVYDRDPSLDEGARRLASVTWSDLRRHANGSRVVQPKAIDFGVQHGLEIEVGAPPWIAPRVPPTRIGCPQSIVDPVERDPSPLRIACLGWAGGEPGAVLVRYLEAAAPVGAASAFEVHHGLVDRIRSDRFGSSPGRGAAVSRGVDEVAIDAIDLVLVVPGGAPPSMVEQVDAALAAGRPVFVAGAGRAHDAAHLRELTDRATVFDDRAPFLVRTFADLLEYATENHRGERSLR
jgi:hypothetical protein